MVPRDSLAMRILLVALSCALGCTSERERAKKPPDQSQISSGVQNPPAAASADSVGSRAPLASDAAIADAAEAGAASAKTDSSAADTGTERAPTQTDAPATAQIPNAPGSIAVGGTTALAPLAGPLAKPVAGQEKIGFYGTDLGRSAVHQGKIFFLFGDTWGKADGTATNADFDDTEGFISLSDFPDGQAVERYVAEHPAPAGVPAWRAEGPPLTLATADGKVAAIVPQRDGASLGMGLGRTPVAVWSDGNQGLFAILNRIQPLACAPADPRCPDGFECDEGLGGGLGMLSEGNMPCVIGVEAGCAAVSSRGFCQDRSSSVYDASNPTARRQAVVYTQELGNEDVSAPGHFHTTAFNTNKFINPCVRSVADFDATREDGVGNRYVAATGSGPNEKLLVWGRPWFSGARGRDSRLYFMYLDPLKYSADGKFELKPQYFTGVMGGLPQFSTLETAAVPLGLSAAEGDASTEVLDEVGELSISWVEPLQKWVMLYGGDYPDVALLLMQGGGLNDVHKEAFGAIFIRFAEQPWGPWSAPEPILRAHTEDDEILPLPNAPKNILARPDCTMVPDCTPEESAFPGERGRFYSAHLVEPWTTVRDDVVDIYWVVSTWRPYEVVLLKTSLMPMVKQ